VLDPLAHCPCSVATMAALRCSQRASLAVAGAFALVGVARPFGVGDGAFTVGNLKAAPLTGLPRDSNRLAIAQATGASFGSETGANASQIFSGRAACAVLLLCCASATRSVSGAAKSSKSSRRACVRITGPAPSTAIAFSLDAPPLAIAPVQMPIQASSPAIFDLLSDAIPTSAAVDLALRPCVVEAPVYVEESKAPCERGWSALPRVRMAAAARVGGARRASRSHSSGRVARAAAASSAHERRSVGARLQENSPSAELMQPSFDASKVRMKIQAGLQCTSGFSSAMNREFAASSKSLSDLARVGCTQLHEFIDVRMWSSID